MVAPALPNPSRGTLANALDVALDAFFAGGVCIRLPYPPSVNHYWQRNRNGSVRISKGGVEYREAVSISSISQLGIDFRTIRRSVGVRVTVFPPDRRRRDLDNVKKALFDACTHAHIWEDDALIDEYHTKRGCVSIGDGYILLEVVEL